MGFCVSNACRLSRESVFRVPAADLGTSLLLCNYVDQFLKIRNQFSLSLPPPLHILSLSSSLRGTVVAIKPRIGPGSQISTLLCNSASLPTSEGQGDYT